MTRFQYAVVSALIFAIAAFIVRFSPVPTNFALLGGLSLFCGCYLRGWQRWALPLGTLGLSDGVGHFFGTADMGFYHPATMLSVYLGFGLMTLVGTLLNGDSQANRRDGAIWVVGGAGLGSSLFFLISNFGSWLDPQMGYASNLSGLIDCYVMAIPFHKWTLVSDLFSAALFFGTYQVMVGSGSTATRPLDA